MRAIDRPGPKLGAVLELDPDAEQIADARDAESRDAVWKWSRKSSTGEFDGR